MKRLLLVAALLAGCASTSTAEDGARKAPEPPPPPPTRAEIEQGLERGVDFLLRRQNEDGSWGSATRTKDLNIYAPIPGAHHAFRTAVTALCLSALIEVDSDRPEVTQAIERCEEWMFARLPRLRRATPDAIYNNWGHAFAIQALVRMYHRVPDDAARREKIVEQIEGQLDRLKRYESVDGGWGYYDFDVGSQKPASSSTSFMTATVLVGLKEAEGVGVETPEKLLKRAVDSIHRQQNPDFTYLYGEYFKWRPRAEINRPGGSLGRSQACNVALRMWGDEKITDEVLKTWLTKLFDRNGWLDMGRKRPVPHESWMAVAGYFFYYGHYYAGLSMDQLSEEDRAPFQERMATLLLGLQEKDGSWWDYPLYDYHQQYGTAMGLMTLLRCLQPPEPTEPSN